MILSRKQKEIVNAPIGNILVEATAGSGKTRVLTERVRHLLEQDHLDGVLSLTFTNKAAEEMRERLSGIEDIERRTFVGTIHSFAQEIIEKHGRHIGYDHMPHIFERDDDRIGFLIQALESYPIGVQETSATYGDGDSAAQKKTQLFEWLRSISAFKRELLTDDEIDEQYPSDSTLQIFREYNAILRQHDGVDFDDLLVLAYRILTEIPSVTKLYARNYPHVCIDEAQDLNNAQYQLIHALCYKRTDSLMMVGDPNQAIYGFNGSSQDFMMKSYVGDFSPRIYKLVENFRSSKKVLALANLLKPESQDVEKAALEGGVAFMAAMNEETEAAWICAQIKMLLDMQQHADIEGDICLEKMTVLGRNRYVFKTLQTQLKEHNWDSYLKKSPGAPIFESAIGKLVDLCMRVILNPMDNLHFHELGKLAELSTSTGHSVRQYLDHWETLKSNDFNGIAKLLPVTIQMMKQENEQNDPDLKKVIEVLKNETTALINSKISAEEINLAMNDLDDLLDHWDRYVRSVPSSASLSLSSFRNTMAMGKTHPDMQPKGLALSTVHTMKGLEKDIVFLMGMGQGTFPDYRAVSAGGSQMAEELNNANVAVTRARRFLYISYPRQKIMPWGDVRSQQPSEFLEKMKLIKVV